MHIHPQTFTFLSRLAGNNNREWFQENREAYEQAWENMKGFTTELIAGLSKIDRFITADIPVSKCLFRIYRDTRFSKDKVPYKTWLGAGISVAGRKLDGPEYYIHIQPGNSFVAAGYWRPEKEHLAAIRQEIDYNSAAFREILETPSFASHFSLDTQDKLKRPPAGYGPDHPEIELLKLKSFTVSAQFSDAELTEKDALSTVLTTMSRMYPFKIFLHEALDEV